MKLKPKTIDPCNGSHPLQHYININKSTASISGTFYVIKWFTYAIEQMDKPTAPFKAVQPVNYYKQ